MRKDDVLIVLREMPDEIDTADLMDRLAQRQADSQIPAERRPSEENGAHQADAAPDCIAIALSRAAHLGPTFSSEHPHDLTQRGGAAVL